MQTLNRLGQVGLPLGNVGQDLRDDTGATSSLQKTHSQEASTAKRGRGAGNPYNPLLVKM